MMKKEKKAVKITLAAEWIGALSAIKQRMGIAGTDTPLTTIATSLLKAGILNYLAENKVKLPPDIKNLDEHKITNGLVKKPLR